MQTYINFSTCSTFVSMDVHNKMSNDSYFFHQRQLKVSLEGTI